MRRKTSCGREIYDDEGNVIITCGEDLGLEREFAQCSECSEKDKKNN